MEGGNSPNMQLQQIPLATAAVSVQPHTDSFSYKVIFFTPVYSYMAITSLYKKYFIKNTVSGVM